MSFEISVAGDLPSIRAALATLGVVVGDRVKPATRPAGPPLGVVAIWHGEDGRRVLDAIGGRLQDGVLARCDDSTEERVLQGATALAEALRAVASEASVRLGNFWLEGGSDALHVEAERTVKRQAITADDLLDLPINGVLDCEP